MAGDIVWCPLAVKFKRLKARWHCTLAYRQDHCARAGCSTEIPSAEVKTEIDTVGMSRR